ncbi:hypothetical protein [Qipengyuania sp. RANM35]|uniref:hypothetical protein n=1 Tax=Qipengyuania sp. RANM35 TaxID=3068635 RepID=UPI0034DB6694
MRDLQLTLPRVDAGNAPPPVSAAKRFWLRGKRRIADFGGIMERRRFEEVRTYFYDAMWRQAASDASARIERLPNGIFRISRRGRSTFVDRSTLTLDSALVDRIMLNKSITYGWLAAKGLRTPQSVRFGIGNIEVALRFLSESRGPVVVKPSDGTGCGHGVTTGITDEAGLRAAAGHAAAFHSQLLVERQLAGASFRLLFLDGQFIDAVRRDPPRLVGDGRSSIRDLARQENERRRACAPVTALSPLVIDMESRNTLDHAGLHPGSIPAAGQSVKVKLAVNENGAAQNHVVRDEVHPDIIAAGARIARDFGIGLAGLDVTATDISAPPAHPDTVFNEVNVGAGLHHHYLVSDLAQAADVAPRILDHIFTTGHGAMEL